MIRRFATLSARPALLLSLFAVWAVVSSGTLDAQQLRAEPATRFPGPETGFPRVAARPLQPVAEGPAVTPLPPPSGYQVLPIDQTRPTLPASSGQRGSPLLARARLPDLPLWNASREDSLKLVLSVALALLALLLGMQRWQTRRPRVRKLGDDVFEKLGTVRLDDRFELLLVRLGSQVILLNHADGKLHTVAAVSDPGEVAALIQSCRSTARGLKSAGSPHAASLGSAVRRQLAGENWSAH